MSEEKEWSEEIECPKCLAKIDIIEPFCPHCSTRLCSNCSNIVDFYAAVCPKCNTKLPNLRRIRTGARVLSGLMVFNAIFALVLVSMFIGRWNMIVEYEPLLAFVVVYWMVLGIVLFPLACGLWMMKKWANTITMIVVGISAVLNLVTLSIPGLVMNLVIISYLFKWSPYFGIKYPPPPSLSPKPIEEAQRICPRCGSQILPADTFCGHCGSGTIPVTTTSYQQPPQQAPARICSNCGVPIVVADDMFCGECGANMGSRKQERICTNCGASVPPDDKFCGACGMSMSAEKTREVRSVTRAGTMPEEKSDVHRQIGEERVRRESEATERERLEQRRRAEDWKKRLEEEKRKAAEEEAIRKKYEKERTAERTTLEKLKLENDRLEKELVSLHERHISGTISEGEYNRLWEEIIRRKREIKRQMQELGVRV